MDELQSIKQALSFLLDQENIRQQELAALNEKIEALNTILSERSKEFTGWVDNREFKDFADKYGEKLAPYAEKMGKIHQDYDLVRDTYDAYNSSDMSVDEDEFIDNTVSALNSYLKDIGIPMDVAVEVKADMNGDGEPETVVAEKFHTMIDHDVYNSRMKDFFDCYQLLTKRELDDEILYDAIKATFDNRGLAYNPDLKLFTEDFINDSNRRFQWELFLKKIQWKEALDFDTVMHVVKERLEPMAERYWENQFKKN